MRRTVALADDHDVNVGVHPGLPDKLGFGRRTIDASPEEVRDYIIYQLGALRAFAAQLDVTFQHVKPHGAMYTMLSESEEHARAVIEGILDIDEDLLYLTTDMNIYEVAQEYPIRVAFEGYVDLDYRSDRSIAIPKKKPPVIPNSSLIGSSASRLRKPSKLQPASLSRYRLRASAYTGIPRTW